MRESVKNHKVVVIGLDGGTFDLIKPWVEEGSLPNLARIMAQGSHGTLMSVIPPLTTPAWASFITGKNPGKHGIFDFAERRENSYDIQWVTASSRNGKSLWKYINEGGLKVGVINIPNNYPLEEVDGFMIAWMDAPGSRHDFAYPRSIISEVNEQVGRYIITILDWKENEDLVRFDANLHRMIDNRAKVVSYLMQKKPWDFFAVLFSATDIAQHCFWSYMDPSHPEYDPDDAGQFANTIKRVYQHVDAVVGDIEKKLDDDTTLILMSDHGAGPLRSVVHLNRWLEEQGFLKFKAGPTAGLSGNCGSIASFLGTKVIREGLSFLKRNLSQDMRSRLKKIFPGMRDKMEGVLFSSLFDWAGTQAYSLGSYGNIYVNLKGREPDGVVEPGMAYETLRNEIMARLLELRDPTTGRKVVSAVYRREELYSGSFLSNAADLVVIWSDEGYHSVQRFGSREDSVFSSELNFHLTNIRFTGHHRLNGIFAIKGPGIRQGAEIQDASIVDLAPTILHVLGLPVPEEMDGRVLNAVFSAEYLDQNPVRYEAISDDNDLICRAGGYDEEESDRIAERLKSLGYIE